MSLIGRGKHIQFVSFTSYRCFNGIGDVGEVLRLAGQDHHVSTVHSLVDIQSCLYTILFFQEFQSRFVDIVHQNLICVGIKQNDEIIS